MGRMDEWLMVRWIEENKKKEIECILALMSTVLCLQFMRCERRIDANVNPMANGRKQWQMPQHTHTPRRRGARAHMQPV